MNIDKIEQNISTLSPPLEKLLETPTVVQIGDDDTFPYGLRPHTRSICWIGEQAITQKLKKNAKILGMDDVEINFPDTCLYDCVPNFGKNRIFLNVKVHDVCKKENKNDIAAVEKLYREYSNNEDYDIIYACFGIRFDKTAIKFDNSYLRIFSAQFLPIYVNPRNDKIQASYTHTPIKRDRENFLNELKMNSTSITL